MYTTEFANGTMTHVFRNGLEVIVDFKEFKISTLKDGKLLEISDNPIDFSSEYSLSDFNELLKTVGNIANY